jgi:hypothetical protein
MALDPITAGIEFAKEIVRPAIAHFWPDASEEQKKKIEMIALQVKAEADEQAELTRRHQADMASDSWLAKNIRPGTLIYILTAYLILGVSDGFGFRVAESYITLLGQWGMLVMSFYFGGRTIEKIFKSK